VHPHGQHCEQPRVAENIAASLVTQHYGSQKEMAGLPKSGSSTCTYKGKQRNEWVEHFQVNAGLLQNDAGPSSEQRHQQSRDLDGLSPLTLCMAYIELFEETQVEGHLGAKPVDMASATPGCLSVWGIQASLVGFDGCETDTGSDGVPFF
jgi:hypothetical protein